MDIFLKDEFDKLEGLLKTKAQKNQFHKVKGSVEETDERHKGDLKIEGDYHRDLEEENEKQMREIAQSNEQIELLKKAREELSGKVVHSKKLERTIDQNKARIRKLKAENKEIRENKEETEKSLDSKKRGSAGRLGWANRYIKYYIRSYEIKLGLLRSKYNSAIESLGDIYLKTNSNKFESLENFQKRIRKLCTDSIRICPKCKRPESHCICEAES